MVPTSVDGLDRPGAEALRRLLLAATASVGRDRDVAPLAPLVAAAPIGRLPDAAALHRVGGCVHEALRTVEGVPPAVLDALAAQRAAAARSHLQYCRALVELRRDLGDLPWVAMKGPVLASSIYHDPGLRTYGDLDLLIGQQAFPDAVTRIEQLGYLHTIHNWPMHEWLLASELGMYRGPINLDVHWHVIYARWERRYFSIEPAQMLRRARCVTVGGHEIPTFDDVDTVLHLALHASRSGGHRLIWSKDLERSIAVLQPDLGELVDRAHAFGCGPPVGLALDRSRRLLGAAVPPTVVDALAGPRMRWVDQRIARFTPTVRFDERDSLPRFVARSTRSRLRTALVDLVERTLRALRRLVPSPAHETGDPLEERSYLLAVARAERLPPGGS